MGFMAECCWTSRADHHHVSALNFAPAVRFPGIRVRSDADRTPTHQQTSIPARCAGAWLLPNPLPASRCMTFNRLYRTYLHPPAFWRHVGVSVGMFGDLIIAGVHQQLGSLPRSAAYELWSPPKTSQLVSFVS